MLSEVVSMGRIRKIFYILFQIIWCFPQNLTGLILFLIYHEKKHRPEGFRGAVVIPWKRDCCTSMGCFIFMDERCLHHRGLLVHEYGHTIQSDILGWLYLPVIFLPSVVWFSMPYFRRFRKEKKYSYYRFYTEAWANHLAEKICHETPAKK